MIPKGMVRSVRLLPVSACLALGMLATAPGWAVQHGERHREKGQIEALEQQWRQAVMTCDVSSMDRLLSEDYVGISMIGQVNTKAQQLDRLRRHALILSDIKLTGVRIKLIGRVAIVTSKASVAGTSDGRAITGRFRYTRVYQHEQSGIWKITNFEITRIPVSRQAETSRSTVEKGPQHS